MPTVKYTCEQRALVLELVSSGVSYKDTSARTGVPYGWVNKLCRKHGLYATRDQDPQRCEALELVKQGLSVRATAQRLMRPVSTIYGWCISAGLTPTGNMRLALAFGWCSQLTDEQFEHLIAHERTRRERKNAKKEKS